MTSTTTIVAPPAISPLNRYAAAFLNIAIAILGAFVLLPSNAFASWEDGVPAGLSLLSVALGAVGVFWARLLGPRESSILKVVASVGGGVIAAVIQWISQGDYSATSFGFLAFAVLSGIATKLGVDMRKDAEVIEAKRDAAGAYNVETLPEPPRHLAE